MHAVTQASCPKVNALSLFRTYVPALHYLLHTPHYLPHCRITCHAACILPGTCMKHPATPTPHTPSIPPCSTSQVSLWDMSNRFATAARLVAVPPVEMRDELAHYSVGGAGGGNVRGVGWGGGRGKYAGCPRRSTKGRRAVGRTPTFLFSVSMCTASMHGSDPLPACAIVQHITPHPPPRLLPLALFPCRSS